MMDGFQSLSLQSLERSERFSLEFEVCEDSLAVVEAECVQIFAASESQPHFLLWNLEDFCGRLSLDKNKED